MHILWRPFHFFPHCVSVCPFYVRVISLFSLRRSLSSSSSSFLRDSNFPFPLRFACKQNKIEQKCWCVHAISLSFISLVYNIRIFFLPLIHSFVCLFIFDSILLLNLFGCFILLCKFDELQLFDCGVLFAHAYQPKPLEGPKGANMVKDTHKKHHPIQHGNWISFC